MLYIIECMTLAGRRRVAKLELDKVWVKERESLPPYIRPEFDRRYGEALDAVTYNIHPLCILGLRRKRKSWISTDSTPSL